jgi:DNA-binding NarL/FixJ family response regulator
MRKSILLVDDSQAVRALARTYIESEMGLEICGEASDGVEGVEKALALTPDLIVMDLSMPRMNGLEAARELRRKMPNVPIILFTLYAREVPSSHAKEAGIAAVISKGEAEKLLPQVLSLLGRPNRSASANVQHS